jgi:hypothetical protein
MLQGWMEDMTEKHRKIDFEYQWQDKLSGAVTEDAGEKARVIVLDGGDGISDTSTSQERLVWTCQMLENLEDYADLESRQEILTKCHCSYPVEDLLDVKLAYRVNGDIDQALKMLEDKFKTFLREVLELEEELIKTILDQGWGLAGKRQGSTIFATKIPKSGYLRDYFQEEDPVEKRRLYCHCPRVRDEVGNDPKLPMEYCYCGAGFYQGIWQEILGQPVKVEMLESVLQGDDVCKIAIYLPIQDL